MDEPCSALDPIATLPIEDLMKELAARFTIIIVTHNMQQAARVFDYTAIPLMADETCEMLRDSVRSFAHDSALAEQVSARDNKVDEIYSQLFRELLTYMMGTPRNITQASSLLFVAKQLERVGDHTTNICEAAIFVITGKHVDLNR